MYLVSVDKFQLSHTPRIRRQNTTRNTEIPRKIRIKKKTVNVMDVDQRLRDTILSTTETDKEDDPVYNSRTS